VRFFAPLVLLIAAQVFALDAAGRMERLQIGGEWCFIRRPPRNLHAGEAVMILHGNGHTVESTTSTWERQSSASRANGSPVSRRVSDCSK